MTFDFHMGCFQKNWEISIISNSSTSDPHHNHPLLAASLFCVLQMPLLTLSHPPLVLGLMFLLQMPRSLFSSMGQPLVSLLSSPASCLILCVFVQDLAGMLS